MPAVKHKAWVIAEVGIRVGADGWVHNSKDESGGAELNEFIDSTQKKLLTDRVSGRQEESDDGLGHHRRYRHKFFKITDIRAVQAV